MAITYMIYSLTLGQSATAVLPCRRAHIYTHELRQLDLSHVGKQLNVVCLSLVAQRRLEPNYTRTWN